MSPTRSPVPVTTLVRTTLVAALVRTTLVAALVASFAACDLGTGPDPRGGPDPCDPLLACEVEGVDIALLGVVPRWTAEQPFEGAVGAHVVEPGDTLLVDMFILNRGTEDATDSILVFGYFRDFQHFVSSGRRIRPLTVGEQFIVRLTFVVPEGERWVVQPQSATLAEGVFAIELPGDADPTNHLGPAIAYHPRVPILEVARLDVPDTMRTFVEYESVLEVTNNSPFVDYDGGQALEFCMSHLGHGYCETGEVAPHSALTVGAIAADDSESFDVVFHVTGQSLWYFDSPSFVFVNPCLALDDEDPFCLHRAASSHEYDVVAIPDLVYECVTSPLAPPDTLRATEAFCLGDGADADLAHTIGVFSGSAGECFRVTRLGDRWAYSIKDMSLAVVPETAEGEHCLPHDGDFYLRAHAPAVSDPAGGILAIDQV